MVERITWIEFRKNGFLWLVNMILHVFGLALVYEFDETGKLCEVYPARVKFRGECRTWTTVKDYIAIPMQYTGLHDKNGVEVYEGDIILAGHHQWKCKVVWDEECARFIALTNEKDVRIIYVDMKDRNQESAVEVIGNIYENPELLNPQN